MIAEKLERRMNNMTKDNFITRKREYKRDLQGCLSCLVLCVVWCLVLSKMASAILIYRVACSVELSRQYKLQRCVENFRIGPGLFILACEFRLDLGLSVC